MTYVFMVNVPNEEKFTKSHNVTTENSVEANMQATLKFIHSCKLYMVILN
jgi:hypothetical protein